MSAKRDSLFPSASVGRAQGAAIVRTPSRESLAVHPLLSPSLATPSGATLDGAKYVPYTPRQRLATTTAPIQQALATSPQGSVPRPHIASLRAAAQSIGIDASSVGWAMLDKIAFEGDASDEWSEIWNVLTKARAALLLPSESCSAHDLITPEFVQDHLVLCDLASRDNTALVTLSGLRGQLVNDTITFRSSLHRSSKLFQGLVSPSASRAASLDALPPLPAYPVESSYPSFTISGFTAALPLPPRATKPPLPPRPGVRGAPTPPARLSMPFVSFFAQRPSTPPPSYPPAATTTAPPIAPPPTELDPVIEISAFVVDTVLSRTEIASAIIGALKGEIAVALNDQPPWLVERVQSFSVPYLPFIKVPAGKKKLQDIGGNPNRVVYAVGGALGKPDELSDRFQAFYSAVEGELRRGHSQEGVGTDTSGLRDPEQVQDKEIKEDESNEAHIRKVLETTESTLCTLLYDRLFLPSTSDDASHNEALSSRIAALNMLDLGLEHLDIDIGDANHVEVDTVVHTCGEILAQLDSTARSPREKAAVLVSAHKLVVEGLSTIPPIRLKSREDAERDSAESPDPTDSVASPKSTTLANTLYMSPSSEPTERLSPLSPLVPTIHLSAPPEQPPAIKPPSAASEIVPLPTSSPVSGDVLLPFLIFSVVKANPHRLVSHLLFMQRFRNQFFGGEESYCLINLMAVAEFLENVDLGALGLGESEKRVPSTADLTPIPITRPSLPESPTAPTLPGEDPSASIRGRVGLGVDVIAGSANKVISGVVDSSFGVLRALLPGQANAGAPQRPLPPSAITSGPLTSASPSSGTSVGTGTGTGTSTSTGETEAAVWNVRPSLGLLRRETGGFSIAGLTAALPGGTSKARNQGRHPEEGQREMVEVPSRPPSLKSHRNEHEHEGPEETEESSEEEGSEEESEEEDVVGAKEDEGEGEAGEEAEEEEEEAHDTRSIRSFESMLSGGRAKRKTNAGTPPAPASTSSRRRKRLTDLTDRLAHGVAGMSRRVQSGDSAHKTTTLTGQLPPPNRRFVECTEQDIKVSEVGELLREYQRLVEAVHSIGGFQD